MVLFCLCARRKRREGLDERSGRGATPESGGGVRLSPRAPAHSRHSTSHVMAQAVRRLVPRGQVRHRPGDRGRLLLRLRQAGAVHAGGPRAHRGGDARDRRRRDLPFTREEMSREPAIEFFRERGEPFKVEILEGRPLRCPPSRLYRQGDFVDLCRGPHVPSTGRLGAFKLLTASGAYWRGRREEPDAPADLRDRVAHPGGARQVPLAHRGGARSATTASSGASSTCSSSTTSRRARRSGCPSGMVLVRELERFARESLDARLPGDLDPASSSTSSCGSNPGHWEPTGEHVQVEVEDESLQPEADELPESPTWLQAGAALVPRSADAATARWGDPSQRALGRALGPDPRAPVHPGRRAHLLPARSAAGRDRRAARAGRGSGTRRSGCAAFKLSTRPDKSLGTGEQWDQAEARAPRGAARERARLRAGHRRRRLLRAEDRHRRARTRWAGSGSSPPSRSTYDAARAHPARVHRQRRAAQAPGGDPPRDLRLVRALRRRS